MNLFKRKQHDLVMTLLVKDEVDIIKYNIDYHLAHGVDFIIAADNGSQDGTREILQFYEREGKLLFVDINDRIFVQNIINDELAQLAKKKYGAKYIFHCDGDEFWVPKKGNIKKVFKKYKDHDVSIAQVVNVLLEDRGGFESFPNDSVYAVCDPLDAVDLVQESMREGIFVYRYLPKVLLNMTRQNICVTPGNHYVINPQMYNIKNIDDISVLHFPIRSKSQFLKKTLKGKIALSMHKTPKFQSYHWKMWHKAFLLGNLEYEYKQTLVSNDVAQKLLREERIKKIDFSAIIKNGSIKI